MKIAILLLSILAMFNANAAEIDVTTKATDVTIYHSGAFVLRSGAVDMEAGVSELVFKDLSSTMVLSSLKINDKRITVLNQTLVRKLTGEQLQQLSDQKEALQKQLTLLEMKYQEPGFVDKVGDLEAMMTFYAAKVLEVKRELRRVERDLLSAEELKHVMITNENAAILRLTVSSEVPIKGTLSFQYITGGIGWIPAYELIVSEKDERSIEVKYLARVMSQTGEDWSNVKISLSSSFPLGEPNTLPVAASPWVLNDAENERPDRIDANSGWQATEQNVTKLKGVSYQAINVPSFLKVRTLNERYTVKSNSTVFTYPILTTRLSANFYYYGFPELDPEAYLVAEVYGWDTLGFVDGVANISYRGNDAGRSNIKFSEATDTLMIAVGKDNSVQMKRKEIADEKYFKITWSSKKRRSTSAYEYQLKNNNTFPVTFQLVDQVPIAQSKYAEVEVEQISGAVHNKETGEIAWNIELAPGEIARRELIFTVTGDDAVRRQRISFGGVNKQRYRSMQAPSF